MNSVFVTKKSQSAEECYNETRQGKILQEILKTLTLIQQENNIQTHLCEIFNLLLIFDGAGIMKFPVNSL